MRPVPPPPHLKGERDKRLWYAAQAVLSKNMCGVRTLCGVPVRVATNGKG